MRYQYSAYTAQQDGVTFETSSLSAAIHDANKYARDAFPKSAKGYGPHIVVRDTSTNDIVYRNRI